jgi:hypothetical protein
MSDWICARQFITLADMEQLYDERVYNRPDQPMTASEIIARKHALLSLHPLRRELERLHTRMVSLQVDAIVRQFDHVEGPDPTLPFDRWLAKATDAIEEHQRRRR